MKPFKSANYPSIKRLVVALTLFLLCDMLHAAPVSNGDKTKPPSVFVDVGGCPVECCKYGDWVTEKRTALVDRPQGKRVVSILSKGNVVKALTGEVISTPIETKADRNIPGTAIKRGDTFYVLHYVGEGYWKVWFRGKITHAPDYGRSDFPRPKAEWWIKVKDSQGKIGWTLQTGNFSDQSSSDEEACQ